MSGWSGVWFGLIIIVQTFRLAYWLCHLCYQTPTHYRSNPIRKLSRNGFDIFSFIDSSPLHTAAASRMGFCVPFYCRNNRNHAAHLCK
ncbi:hypothetical protein EV421DRAFT_1369346 [Armillaria borealis]|uniref:Uncharacterized protein n=1 Tax=Armillaria borealis TaxID=47425 RepID=A0AA39J0I8_9AGAR|nr:hypothetical protein EV421DRAFT_1369346 [Armillaria borealis]